MSEKSNEITQYLRRWRAGSESAFEEVLPLVYAELRQIARRYRSRENGAHTLQTTEIIHEAYLKLVDQSATDWQDRSHFFAVASRVMRHLLVDYARTKNYQKRGGGAEKISLEDIAAFATDADGQVLALDEALKNLAQMDERKAQIVELRYFGGLSAAETADVIGVSEITVKREWLKAKAWLYNEMAAG